MVQRCGITIEEFEGFFVLVVGDRTMQCTRYVPALMVSIENYSVTDYFFVVDVPDTNVVMGVQWFYSLGWVTTDWQKLEMGVCGARWEDGGTERDALIPTIDSLDPSDGDQFETWGLRVGNIFEDFRGWGSA